MDDRVVVVVVQHDNKIDRTTVSATTTTVGGRNALVGLDRLIRRAVLRVKCFVVVDVITV